MEPISKSLNLSEQTDTTMLLLVDRISNLPPDLIGNILSFLPTEEAVATSVLSTKWKWSWTFVTRLDFLEGLSEFAHGQNQIELRKASFISFVYRVLFYRKPTPLNYLGFVCNQGYYASHVRAWVSAALSVGVKEIYLSILVKDNTFHMLPSDMFSCNSLVKLKLCGGVRIYVPPIVCLPSLEVLSLTDVFFYDEDLLGKFLIGCPVLKEFENVHCWDTPWLLPLELFSCRRLARLKLDGFFVVNPPTLVSMPSLEALHLSCVEIPDYVSFRRFLLGCPLLQEMNFSPYVADATVVHIDVPMLTNLTISLGSDGDVTLGKMVLDTPSLQYLKVDGLAAGSLEVIDLSQLVEADIRGGHIGIQHQVASNLILALSNVQTLHLCDAMIEVITKHGCKLPKFDKMTTLKLCSSHKVGWALLPDLLENSPVLETLVFQHGPQQHLYSKDRPSNWYTPQKVPYCVTHHLKVIEIVHFRADKEEEEIIRYLTENRGVF